MIGLDDYIFGWIESELKLDIGYFLFQNNVKNPLLLDSSAPPSKFFPTLDIQPLSRKPKTFFTQILRKSLSNHSYPIQASLSISFVSDSKWLLT